MGKEQEVIVCIGFPTWEDNYTKSTVELMKVISKHIPVVYVNYPFTFKDVFSGMKGQHRIPWKAILGWAPSTQQDGKVTVLYPPAFLPNQFLSKGFLFNWSSQWNAKRLIGRLTKHLAAKQLKPLAIVNAFNPFVGAYYPDGFREKYPQIYYCYDEINQTQWSGKHGGYLETLFLTQTQGHIFSSAPLQKSKSTPGKPSFLVKNGVDFSLFNQANIPISKRGEQDRALYIGAMDDRLDYPLLNYLAAQLPKWQFDFFGPVKSDAFHQLVQQHQNINYKGNFPAAEIPVQITKHHIGLIPFVRNAFTKNIYPLKINEYLAAGLNVVTTPFGDLSDFESTVYFGNSHESFLSSLRQARKQLNDEQVLKNASFASHNSWSSRGEAFLKAVAEITQNNQGIINEKKNIETAKFK
ncbi:hypothetical protein [Persicobacter psychrovividus]|uniref:Glycosyltransferase involved in cell wall biosynthesis n=1 Tax=Persicobacter psychrovividus TaxID=387638 RepID=A0ABM7VEJ6_9BACT|nr:hypothetical protein PEPS_16280 [Persicobacter psychrovividus]